MKKESPEKTFEELTIFLNVIDEDSNNILKLIKQRFDVKPLGEDENAFLSHLEEAEEIRKALAAIRDKIRQMLSYLYTAITLSEKSCYIS